MAHALWRKRLFSCALTGMLLFTLGASQASAATAYFIRFYDKVTAKESQNTRIVEGSSINIRATLPPFYEFSDKTPFAVSKTGSGPVPDPSIYFDITKNSALNYTLIAKNGSAGLNTGSAEYVLDAIYTANLSEGTGNAVYIDVDNDINEQFALRVVAESAVSITEDSTLAFTATSTENELGMLSFSTVTARKGFNDYNGGTIRSSSIMTDITGRYIPIRIESMNPSNPKPFVVKAYLQGVNSSYKIKKGTQFEITFLRQTLNSMILTVITPQKAVDDTVSSVRENPTDPEATVTGQPYISLKTGDTLDSIKNNFTMLRRVHRDNVDVDLEWTWVPDDPKYLENVKIRTNLPTVATFDIVDRPKEDMRGKLVVKAIYNGVSSSVAELPILIYGTGTPPKFLPLRKLTGNPGETENPLEERLDKLPSLMDVYRGDADFSFYTKKPLGPYQIRGSLEYGTGRGAAQSVIINSLGGGGEVEIRVDGSPVPYVLGTPLPTPGTTRTFEITATKLGQLTLQFEYYDANGDAMKSDWQSWQTYIHDTRPNTDGRLAALGINVLADTDKDQEILNKVYPNPKGFIDYGFNPDTNTYTVTVPNKASHIKIVPRIPNGTGASSKISVSYDTETELITSGDATKDIPLEEQRTKTIIVTATAEDGSNNTYTLSVTRSGKETISSLNTFTARQATPPNSPDLIQGFTPANFGYEVSVPYSVTQAIVEGVTTSPWSTAAFNVQPGQEGKHADIHTITADLSCDYDPVTGTVTNNVTTVTLRVWAEDNSTTSDYVVRITREPPSDNRRLSLLSVEDENGAPVPFSGGQNFSPDALNYSISIPYSAKSLTISAQPEDILSTQVTLEKPTVYGGETETKPYRGAVVLYKNLDVTQDATHNPEKDSFTYSISTTAESGRDTDPPYTIDVTRLQPNTDNSLTSMTITDESGTAAPDYAFRPETFEYDVVVPYLFKSVVITPVASFPMSTIEVDGQKITAKRPSATFKLEPGAKKNVPVIVTAESGDVQTYLLHITRSKPSNETRLASLNVAGLTLKPTFVPSKTEYEVTIPKAMQNYTITPTAIDPNATITIGDKTIASGATTAPITPEAAESKVDIIVTAQDGTTKKTYTVRVLAEALFPSSNNADLQDLVVKEGSMTPKFKPGIFAYEVAVKPETTHVDILPTLAEPHATLKVTSGTKALGDYNSNYSTALTSDKTDITVTVESQDKTVTREYKVTVYRNTDGKEGIYKPITADMVDYETDDPIIVDVSVYHIVAADVFNKLKKDYPQKTMIIKGNDYAFEFKGSDIKQLVPNTEEFDFSLSFTSPDEPKVRAFLDRNGNGGLHPVYVYFAHHGPLPAAMKFTLSLGGAYKNQALYWNYYNAERDRVDCYGTVNTNTQGTFSVQMSHMSTYLVTGSYINGAEDKSGMEGGVNGSLSSGVTSGKRNPATEVGKDS